MTTVTLIVWKNIYNTDQYIVLYEFQIPFEQSPTTTKYWQKFCSFQAINPMIRPLPDGTELFNCLHFTTYPFNLNTIYSLFFNIMDVDEKGTYFIAWTAPYKGKIKLPVEKFISNYNDIPNIYVENLIYF